MKKIISALKISIILTLLTCTTVKYPLIEKFESSNPVALEGEKVKIFWKVKDAEKVSINEFGNNLKLIGEKEVLLDKTKEFKMIVYLENKVVIERVIIVPTITLLEKEIIEEVNIARTNPKEYLEYLKEQRKYYQGKLIRKTKDVQIITKEGVNAVEEAISFLSKTHPLKPLKISKGLTLAAKQHSNDIGPSGMLSHQGSDGSEPWDRVSKYADYSSCGENLYFGIGTAREIVAGLIVDDGVPSRGHRKNIFNSDFTHIGVSINQHKTFGVCCVMVFGTNIQDKY